MTTTTEPGQCPNCGGYNLDYGDSRAMGPTFSVKFKCLDCLCKGLEHYDLSYKHSKVMVRPKKEKHKDLTEIGELITELKQQKEKMTAQQYEYIMVKLKGLEAKLPPATPQHDPDDDSWGIDGFEEGKWYVCRLSEKPHGWNECTKSMFDGKPHLCMSVGKRGEAEFSDVPGDQWNYFYTGRVTKEDFKEVPAPKGK